MPDIAGKLFPNLTTLIVQLLSTGVLLLIFKKYLWKNVMEYFAKRANYIESTINEAKEMNEKASANLETAEKEAREAASKYRDILDQAKDDGQKVRQQIIDQANEEARAKIEQAQKEIENVKLKFEIEKEEYNKDVPEGFIISQDPTYMEKFNKVKQGSTVKVVVSKGEEKTTVPKVVGMEKDKAVKALEDAKLKVEIVEESSKKVQEGYVISQETSPDTEAFAGDTIKIHVSTGVEKATVPDVIGKSQADAKKTLEAQGFVVAVTTSEDSSKENGIVLKQSLDSGKTVEKGSTVTITVNSYEASKTMSVNINVKAITGGYSEETSNSNTTENKTVKTVSITLKSGNNTLYSDSGVDKNTTSKSTTISGKGSMDLTLTITDSNGGSWTRTKSVNFSTDSSVNFN